MKASWYYRLLILLGGIMLVLSGVAMLLISMGWLPPEWVEMGAGTTDSVLVSLPSIVAIPWAIIAAVLGAFIIRAAFHKRTQSSFIVQKNELGELRIAVKAVDNLVKKCIEARGEIKLNSTRISNTRDGVNIDLTISLVSNVSIPLTVAALQKQIKQYLMMCSGVDVHEVLVSVESADGVITESPYLLPDVVETPLAQETGHKEKRTLHQRIFGRDEQPVVLPPHPEESSIPDSADISMLPEETVAEADAPNEGTTTGTEAQTSEASEQAEANEPNETNETVLAADQTPPSTEADA